MKKLLKKIFGVKFLRYCKNKYIYMKMLPNFIFKKKIKYNETLVEKIDTFSLKHKNVFFGYYDINPLKDNKLLVHSIRKNANTKKDAIDIGYFDIETKQYHFLTKSLAWCWQQGSRLRWSKDNNIIIYNDIENGSYCTRFFDINSKKIIKTVSSALYDIDLDENYGISVNFSRLQRLRPGYGYDKIQDYTETDYYPKDDGLFIVDINENTKELLISLYDLAKDVKDYKNYEHYINHVSFSPNGKKIMFFHLYVPIGQKYDWRVRLCVFDIYSKKLQILEDERIASHYDWIDDERLIITTGYYKTNLKDYRIYNLLSEDYKILEDSNLCEDGHPTYFENNKFISDTYPDDNSFQHLFKFDIENNKYTEILSIFSNPSLRDDKRCDLHPRLCKNNIICIDSTFKASKRSVIYIKLK